MLEDHNQYAPMLGMPALRAIIAEVIKRSFNNDVDPETEITITSGATEAIYAVIAAFITPGDEVIVFDPSYDSYNPVIRLNGGIPYISIYCIPIFPSIGIWYGRRSHSHQNDNHQHAAQSQRSYSS